MVFSSVKIFGHQQTNGSIGGGVIDKHTPYSTVLQIYIIYREQVIMMSLDACAHYMVVTKKEIGYEKWDQIVLNAKLMIKLSPLKGLRCYFGLQSLYLFYQRNPTFGSVNTCIPLSWNTGVQNHIEVSNGQLFQLHAILTIAMSILDNKLTDVEQRWKIAIKVMCD